MSVREYIGARYVPVFAEPTTWDNTRTYEPLTIVLYQGNSYTSKQYVPAGIDIDNSSYWAQTGNYNAQIEAYRAEVQAFDGRIDDLETDSELINDILPSNDFDATNTVKKYVDDSVDNLSDDVAGAISALRTTLESEITTEIGTVTSKFPNMYYGKKLVVIGDSFSDDSRVTLPWYNYVCNAFGMTLARYAVGGAGFVHTGSSGTAPTFETQIQNAYNDGIRDSDIGAIVVLGGINDFLSGKSYIQTRQGVDALYTAINNRFPLSVCKTFICFGNTGYTHQSSYDTFMPWYGLVKSQIDAHEWNTVDYVQYWTNFFGRSVFSFDNDLTHPDNSGNRLIAHYVIQVLSGVYTGVYKVLRNTYTGPYTEGSNSATVTGVPYFENGRIHWSGTIANLVKAYNTWNDVLPLIEHPMMGTKIDIIPAWSSAADASPIAIGINEQSATIYGPTVSTATTYFLPCN